MQVLGTESGFSARAANALSHGVVSPAVQTPFLGSRCSQAARARSPSDIVNLRGGMLRLKGRLCVSIILSTERCLCCHRQISRT